jgi:formylmethanofuran dehydrogenase subunit C
MALLIPGAGLVDATVTLLIPGVGLVEQAAVASEIAAAGSLSITGSADLDATGALLAAGSLAINGVADLDATGNLLAAGALSITGSAGFNVEIAFFPSARLARVDPRDRVDSVPPRTVESVPPRTIGL